MRRLTVVVLMGLLSGPPPASAQRAGDASASGAARQQQVAAAPRHALLAHDGQVTALAYSPDGARLYTAGTDRMVKVWSTEDGSMEEAFEAHEKAVLCLAVSPDGKRLATGGADCTVRIWDALTCRPLTRIAAHTEPVKALAWAPDGGLVASGGADRLIEIWRPDGAQVGVVVGHDGPITGLAFTKDGLALLSSASDNYLKVWRVSDLGLVARLKAQDRSVALVAVSSDRSGIAVGSPGGNVKLYALTAEAAEGLATGVMNWNIASIVATRDGGLTATLGADRSLSSLAANDLPTLVAAAGRRGAVTASTIR